MTDNLDPTRSTLVDPNDPKDPAHARRRFRELFAEQQRKMPAVDNNGHPIVEVPTPAKTAIEVERQAARKEVAEARAAARAAQQLANDLQTIEES